MGGWWIAGGVLLGGVDIEISAGPNVFKSLSELFGYDKKQYAPGETPRFAPPDGAGSAPAAAG